MTPKEAINTGGQPAHWANQCLLLLEPFVEYLHLVRDTNDMHPVNQCGNTVTAYSHAYTFYGDNGTLMWISTRLAKYTSSALSTRCLLESEGCGSDSK